MEVGRATIGFGSSPYPEHRVGRAYSDCHTSIDAELGRVVRRLASDADSGSREEEDGRPPYHLLVSCFIRVRPDHERGGEDFDHNLCGSEDLSPAGRLERDLLDCCARVYQDEAIYGAVSEFG
jgi:hypothetical protein